MANKFKGEVPFPFVGKGAFVRFSLDDMAECEDAFGPEWIGDIEVAARNGSAKNLSKVLSLVLKTRDADGSVTRIWDDIDKDDLQDKGFAFNSEVGKVILDAMYLASPIQKTYDEVIKEAEEARKKLADDAIVKAKEAAKEHDVPFETILPLFNALWGLPTEPESAPSTSGN